MADLKISQLTETNAAAKGDYFIINKGDGGYHSKDLIMKSCNKLLVVLLTPSFTTS